MTTCGPGSSRDSRNSSRITVGDIPKRSARPAQTPAIIRPLRGRTRRGVGRYGVGSIPEGYVRPGRGPCRPAAGPRYAAGSAPRYARTGGASTPASPAAKTRPASGCAARCARSRFSQEVVTNNRRPPAPPIATEVGWLTGSGHTCSVAPSGPYRRTSPAPCRATHSAPSVSSSAVTVPPGCSLRKPRPAASSQPSPPASGAAAPSGSPIRSSCTVRRPGPSSTARRSTPARMSTQSSSPRSASQRAPSPSSATSAETGRSSSATPGPYPAAMQALPDAARAGWDAIVADPGRALVALDYDGVLAPIVRDPGEAVPAPGAIDVLRRLAGRVGTLAVVTGRPDDQVVELGGLAAVPGLLVEAQYGAEHWSAGELSTPGDPPGVVAARAALPAALAGAGADPGVWVEDKRLALVVHARRAADPDAELARLD